MQLTTAAVCGTFDVDPSTISRWVAMGHLRAERFGDGRTSPLAFDRADVEAFGKALREIEATRKAAS